jgi:hypothetical protein
MSKNLSAVPLRNVVHVVCFPLILINFIFSIWNAVQEIDNFKFICKSFVFVHFIWFTWHLYLILSQMQSLLGWSIGNDGIYVEDTAFKKTDVFRSKSDSKLFRYFDFHHRRFVTIVFCSSYACVEMARKGHRTLQFLLSVY